MINFGVIENPFIDNLDNFGIYLVPDGYYVNSIRYSFISVCDRIQIAFDYDRNILLRAKTDNRWSEWISWNDIIYTVSHLINNTANYLLNILNDK